MAAFHAGKGKGDQLLSLPEERTREIGEMFVDIPLADSQFPGNLSGCQVPIEKQPHHVLPNRSHVAGAPHVESMLRGPAIHDPTDPVPDRVHNIIHDSALGNTGVRGGLARVRLAKEKESGRMAPGRHGCGESACRGNRSMRS